MLIETLSTFPHMYDSVMGESMMKRAQEKGILEFRAHDLRDWTHDRHRTTDDDPYGGGAGLVMKCDPIFEAVEAILGKEFVEAKLAAAPPQGESQQRSSAAPQIVFLAPQGRPFDDAYADKLAAADHLLFICGHYEGIDQRFIDECVDEELSMGDFVVTGGEIPAMAVTDAICRMVPGVLPEEECFTEESHWAGLLEYPQYSRPDEWHGRRVPDVLLSGHHENVAKWRKKESYKRTMLRRPDLWAQFDEKQLKTKSEKKVLAEAKAEAEAIRAAEVKKAEESDTETPVE